MAGATGARRYGALGHISSKWGHGKIEQLTSSPMEVVVASERASKDRVDDGGELQREHVRGLGLSCAIQGQNKRMRAPTVMVCHGEAHGHVVDGIRALARAD